MSLRNLIRNLIPILILTWSLGPGWQINHTIDEQARKYTRSIEFDYFTWTLDTLWTKSVHQTGNSSELIVAKNSIREYLHLIEQIQALQSQINAIYIDPTITDPRATSSDLSSLLSNKYSNLERMTPAIESILQDWVRQVLEGNGLTTLSVVFPPVLFHSSSVPPSLFLSPREKVELIGNISLQPSISTEEMVDLENQIEADLDVSALVEPVGGLGTYPTMIMMTTDLNWLVETIAHEWVHNYLYLHPLGMHYDASPELRTMNETVANLIGKEIGQQVIKTFYPEILSLPTEQRSSQLDVAAPQTVFDFRNEMRITRIETDRLLSTGNIQKAEAYMEERRHLFWEHGYLIRRINQAYFAFYGAYNDIPGGGASGEDPVGPAVQCYKAQFSTLGDFLRAIARMSSYGQLLEDMRAKQN